MKKNLKAKKSLGQNFLIDTNIINKIIKIGNINKNSNIIEIGSGYGSLTENIIAKNPKNLLAIEKDDNLAFFLKHKFYNFNNIEIINGDILNLINNNKFKGGYIVFGNLPYNISTKILVSLATLKKWPPWYDVLILMFQKEVADRIIAKENTKNFSRLSVLANWKLDIKKNFDISNNCFFPKPKVNSTLLSFMPKKEIKYALKNPLNLEYITKVLFSSRRKMINKNFKKLFYKSDLVAEKLNIDLKKRPGEFPCETFYKIAVYYEKLLT